MNRGPALLLTLLLVAACGSPADESESTSEPPPPEVYVGLESLEPSADDPVPVAPPGQLVVYADTMVFVGENEQARVWVGRDRISSQGDAESADDSTCLYAEIGPDRLQASTPCAPTESLLTSGIAIYPSAHHEWVEIYLVPDGFGDVEVPGLERVSPNLYIGDTRETAPPGQTITGQTGSFRLVNDVEPSTA